MELLNKEVFVLLTNTAPRKSTLIPRILNLESALGYLSTAQENRLARSQLLESYSKQKLNRMHSRLGGEIRQLGQERRDTIGS